MTMRRVLTRTAAFLIGLNVLRNLHVLHLYGGVDGHPEPYVQIVQVRVQRSAAVSSTRLTIVARS